MIEMAQQKLDTRTVDAVGDLTVAETIVALERVLLTPLVGVVAGVDAASTLQAWQTVGAAPAAAERRLRAALRVVRILEQRLSDGEIRMWFVGRNSHLGRTSPALAIAGGTLPPDVVEIAARDAIDL